MKLRILLPISLFLVSVVIFWFALGDDPADAPQPAPAVAIPVAAASPPQPAASLPPTEPPDATNLLYRRPPPETLEELMARPEAAERMDAYRKQQLAAARFSEGVDDGNFEVADLHRSVVSFFKTVELEPVLDDEAMIIGLELREIYDHSPLRETDLVVGDLITKINDERLHDPADVPAILEGLERDLSLCVDRDGSEVCRRITLD